MRACICLFAICLAASALGAPVINVRYGDDDFLVQAPEYVLQFDLRHPCIALLRRPHGWENLPGGRISLSVRTPQGEFSSLHATVAARVHVVRLGWYLTEVQVQNIVLATAEGEEWPGLGEMTLYCHRDRVYARAAFLANDGEWVANDMVVYQAREGHRQWPAGRILRASVDFEMGAEDEARQISISHAGTELTTEDGDEVGWEALPSGAGGMYVARITGTEGLALLFPHESGIDYYAGKYVGGGQEILWQACAYHATQHGDKAARWEAGDRHEVHFALMPASHVRERDLLRVRSAEAYRRSYVRFQTTRGEYLGYDARKGVCAFKAVDASSPEPPPGYVGGCTYEASAVYRDLELLVDQFNDWGGLRGAIVKDGQGNPVPIQPQISANFPELHEHGERDWGYVTYPISLRRGETKAFQVDHLYNGYGQAAQILLMSLENIGRPPLLQTSVAVAESHTMTTGLEEMRFNDFRRLKTDYGGYRSVSAVLPTFFSYRDVTRQQQVVRPETVDIAHVGPLYTEYTVSGRTTDGKAQVDVRVWQSAMDDLTRVFCEVDINVLGRIALDREPDQFVHFLKLHTFNPMVYLKLGHTGSGGEVQTVDLDLSGTIRADRAELGEWPFLAAYHAPNGLEGGVPCSDIVGNPAFVLLSWEAQVNGEAIEPALYAFAARDTGSGGDYSRDVSIVPAEKLAYISPDSHVRYSAVGTVYGDSTSSHEEPTRLREQFALNRPTLTVGEGEVLGEFPWRMRVPAGATAVEFGVSGGANRMPVLVEGFAEALPIELAGSDGGAPATVHAATDRDWYQCYRSGEQSVGYAFLVDMQDGSEQRLILRQVAPTGDAQ
ncbi:MAG: hypothetical protein ACE5R4_13635 [Armatimonadota bacterium]